VSRVMMDQGKKKRESPLSARGEEENAVGEAMRRVEEVELLHQLSRVNMKTEADRKMVEILRLAVIGARAELMIAEASCDGFLSCKK